jgi:hypothetical protein
VRAKFFAHFQTGPGVNPQFKMPLVRLKRRWDSDVDVDMRYCGWRCEVVCAGRSGDVKWFVQVGVAM